MTSDAFPERKFSENSYTHDFEKLAVSAKIKDRLDNHKKVDKVFEANWDVVRLWSEEKRYHEISRVEAEEIFVAITDTSHGVLPWIKTLW